MPEIQLYFRVKIHCGWVPGVSLHCLGLCSFTQKIFRNTYIVLGSEKIQYSKSLSLRHL